MGTHSFYILRTACKHYNHTHGSSTKPLTLIWELYCICYIFYHYFMLLCSYTSASSHTRKCADCHYCTSLHLIIFASVCTRFLIFNFPTAKLKTTPSFKLLHLIDAKICFVGPFLCYNININLKKLSRIINFNLYRVKYIDFFKKLYLSL